MDNFTKANAYVALSEGGRNFKIINGKPVLSGAARNDLGGATAYGITWNTLRAAYKDGITSHNDICKLTKQEADEIYKVRYWAASKADLMDWPLCLLHYDAAVNHGVGGAGRLLQKAINAVYGRKTVGVDGAVGDLTLSALDGISSIKVAYEYLVQRLDFYDEIIRNKPSQKVFQKGWYARVARLKSVVDEADS